MKPGVSGALSDLPAGGGWDFGGFAYGLEPLLLPVVGAPDAEPVDVVQPDAYAEICRYLQVIGEDSPPVLDVEPEDLFWFRWITGHQVCFIVWRLIAQGLDDLAEGRRPAGEVISSVSRYVDGYSAMLLYTGSCPPDLYNVLIRPSMRQRHRAFSGSWAPDYWPIRDLFRRRRLPPMVRVDTGELTAAITMLHRVHDGVAARLVANGRSLLREAQVRGPGHRMAGMIYDSYFTTLRAAVPRHEVVAQLLRRLVAVAQDVAANGLYPVEGDGDRPPELETPEVLKFEGELGDTLLSVARCACELSPGPSA
ncbi:hypothetical protein [Actinoplanes sp. NPDC026670]|uniref:hypothetical protein n=1 Tax=Actinoplanes sp. NPDC026670 TaxID=3154700 RepID=UPI0033EEE811